MTVNDNQIPRRPVSVNGEQPDDISALSNAFSLTAFDYIDIARRERLAAIFTRWPLLGELHDLPQEREQ